MPVVLVGLHAPELLQNSPALQIDEDPQRHHSGTGKISIDIQAVRAFGSNGVQEIELIF